MIRLLASLLLLLSASSTAFAQEESNRPSIPVIIHTQVQDVTLQLELATTVEAREHGLMHRESLKPNDGMLFEFPQAQNYAFWMKDTPLPLDMLFVDSKRRIVFIAPDTTPNSLTPIHAGQKVTTVIELAAGRAALDNIRVGDTVMYTLPASTTVE